MCIRDSSSAVHRARAVQTAKHVGWGGDGESHVCQRWLPITSVRILNCRTCTIDAGVRILNCAGPGTASSLIPEAPE
eukprot:10645862-Alexandrium_andersonii.AAC.1